MVHPDFADLFPLMANTKSAIKNARKNVRRHDRNARIKSRLKTLAKALKAATAGTDATATGAAARAYISALDKAASDGVIHRNSASRHKSVCAKYLAAK
jgi:small subunit ribosomal protein S20